MSRATCSKVALISIGPLALNFSGETTWACTDITVNIDKNQSSNEPRLLKELFMSSPPNYGFIVVYPIPAARDHTMLENATVDSHYISTKKQCQIAKELFPVAKGR